MAIRAKRDANPATPIRPDINIDSVARPRQRPDIDANELGGGGRTIDDLDLSRLRRRRGGGGDNIEGPSRERTFDSPARESSNAASIAAKANEELERQRREQERNEKLGRERDQKIADQQKEKQKKRKSSPVLEVSGIDLPDGSVRLSDSDLLRALDGSPSKQSAAERMESSDGIPTGRVYDNEWLNSIDAEERANRDDINALNDFLRDDALVDDYIEWANENPEELDDDTYTGRRRKAVVMPEYDPMTDDLVEMYLEDPDRFPEGEAKEWLKHQAQERLKREAADKKNLERLTHAAEVGKRQRQKYDAFSDAERKFRLANKSRYKTIDDIRKAAADYVESNAGARDYEFADDRVFTDEVWYDSDLKDKDIRDKITEDAGVMWSDVSDEIDSRRQSTETSLDAVRHGGAAEFDPNSTIADNVKNAEDAIDGNARLIANPLLIKWGSERIERVKSFGGKTMARFRFSNVKGRDVEGAIGSVMRYYNCSTMSVMRLVIRQLGLGIDTHGKICGVDAEDFRLPDAVIIEACNDILEVAKRNGGIPTGVNVMGRPYGFNNSRDDTGMFPILGGTRCIPMGHIPLKTFEDISGPGSPLYQMSPNMFYTRNVELYINNVQPHQLANCVGSRAFQSAALNIANEGMLSIDGLPNEMYNIPEHKVYRTKAVLQADLMDTSDEQCLEAKEQRLRNMTEISSRWYRMNFKDGKSRANSSSSDVPPGTILGPGEDSRSGPVNNIIRTFTDMTALCRALVAGVILTSPIEGMASVATQGATIGIQKVGKKVAKSVYHLNENFDRTEFLDDAITSKDGLEAIEAYMTLFKVAGRTAVQAFMLDRNDSGSDRRYKAATKANVYDFLQRWKVSQTPEIAQRIESALSRLMVGGGFKKAKARQFLDMALIEMQNNRIHGGEVYNSDNLEEIAHSGESRYGAGEALVSALMDMQGGYEAFKTIDYTSIDRTMPAIRATDAVLRNHGVTELAFRQNVCFFFKFAMGRVSRATPGFCSVSYIMSHVIKKAATAERNAMDEKYDPEDKILRGFAKGFRQAADAVRRISDYQVGMDSADFWVGLRKNMLYDATIFGSQYVIQAIIKRAVIAMLGGMEPPEDESKITLPWEWKLNLTGLPMKDAWFMDDLIGSGAPLAYAWEILEGYDVKDRDGNVVRHVDAYSEEAKKTAWYAYKNMIRNYGPTKDAIDAIEMITDFPEQVEELMGKDIWRQSPAKTLEGIVSDIDKEMSDYYEGTDYNLTVDEMRREWALGRMVGFAYDLFDDMTPQIANQVLPGTRDSFMRDKYQHVTKLEYNLDDYDEETAKNEYRVQKRPYVEWQAALRTRDNATEAFLTDWVMSFFDNQSNFSYMEMPERSATDPRPRSENNHMNRWALDQYFENGNMKPDITGPDGKPDGKEDSRDEREEYLFDKAEELCDYIDENFISQNRYPEWAVQNDHFIIPPDIRSVAKNYCYYLLGSKNRKGQLEKDIEARKEEEGGRVSQEEWDDYLATREKYNTILYDYLNNENIPWRAPRYRKLESSTETMYVDDDGNATTWDDPNAHEIKYSYGDPRPETLSPLVSPIDQGNYDLQGFTWDTLLDDDNNPISQSAIESIYDQAAAAGKILMGMDTGKEALDVMTAGGKIEKGQPLVPFNDRGWEVMEDTLPSWYEDLDKETIDKKYGIDSYMPDDETTPDDTDDDDDSTSDGNGKKGKGNSKSIYNNRSYGGGGSYRGSGGYYYSYGSGGSNYNPRIYNSSHNVYSQRASGLSTRSPYKATTSYLRPSFYTSGSRTSYRRQQ